MTRALLFFLIVDALALLLGAYLIYGFVKGHKVIVDPPAARGSYVLWFEKLFGKGFVGYFHAFFGLLVIIFAVFGLIYALFNF
jgi:hypothetical protein